MKLRQGGMPEEAHGESLVDIPAMVDNRQIDARFREVMELGCG
jgi:hypothetical protein